MRARTPFTVLPLATRRVASETRPRTPLDAAVADAVTGALNRAAAATDLATFQALYDRDLRR